MGKDFSQNLLNYKSYDKYVSWQNTQKAKGRSSRKNQMEFHHILKEKYYGKHLWARGYFSSTSGNVTDDIINEYIDNHEDGSPPPANSNIRME